MQEFSLEKFAVEAIGYCVKEAFNYIQSKKRTGQTAEQNTFPSVNYDYPFQYFESWSEEWKSSQHIGAVKVNRTGMKFSTQLLQDVEAKSGGLKSEDVTKLCFYEIRFNPMPKEVVLYFKKEALGHPDEKTLSQLNAIGSDYTKTTRGNKPKIHFRAGSWKLSAFNKNASGNFVEDPNELKEALDEVIKYAIPAFEKEMRKFINT